MTSTKSVFQRATAWIVGDDTGASSESLWAAMMGAPKKRPDHPYDPGDFGRCARLLRMIPEWRERLPEMTSASPEWAALVANWQRIEDSMQAEVGLDWQKAKSAPETYALMNEVLDTAERRAA